MSPGELDRLIRGMSPLQVCISRCRGLLRSLDEVLIEAQGYAAAEPEPELAPEPESVPWLESVRTWTAEDEARFVALERELETARRQVASLAAQLSTEGRA